MISIVLIAYSLHALFHYEEHEQMFLIWMSFLIRISSVPYAELGLLGAFSGYVTLYEGRNIYRALVDAMVIVFSEYEKLTWVILSYCAGYFLTTGSYLMLSRAVYALPLVPL